MAEPKENDEERQQALLKEYGEVCNNFRMLTDIRFKLLAFLPIASAAAVTVLRAAPTNEASPEGIGGIGLALSLFGLIATLGLATYNARNDQLYDELVGRAAEIERSLGIPDGAFANRPTSWLRIPLRLTEWKVDHRTAVSTIYGASAALWLFGVLSHVLQYPTAIMVAITVTFLGSFWIKSQKEQQSKQNELRAKEAMDRLVGPPDPKSADNVDDDFIAVCTRLSGTKEEEVRKRAEFYSRLRKPDRERLNHYLRQGEKDLEAAHLISLLTDFPPHWIYDSYHERKGRVLDSDSQKRDE